MSVNADDSPLAVDDPARIHWIRDVLDQAGYTWPRVLELLGEPEAATGWLARREIPRLLLRTAGGSPLEILVRLFLLGVSVADEVVHRAVAPTAVGEWVDLGLLETADGGLAAPLRVMPTQELLLIQESPWHRPPLDKQVMPVSSSTLAVMQTMIRRPGEAALDVGTGCGVLALLMARNSGIAIGTDCNPRALNMATFNAHLNRLPNATFRCGNLFEPVAGHTFDYVLANPPYVISPDKRFIYRDSGLPGDEICARVVQTMPRFLRPGGFAQVAINWAQVAGQDWRDRLSGWLEGSGCDAWLLRNETIQPARYATTWLPSGDDLPPFAQRFDEWMAYYEEQRIEAIGTGLITMRRRPGGQNWFAHDNCPPQVGFSGEAIVQGFVQRDFLAANPDDQTLLGTRFRLNPVVQAEQQLQPAPPAWRTVANRVRLAQGLTFALNVDALGMDLLVLAGYNRPLGAALSEAAVRLKQDPVKLQAAAMPFVRCLIEQGFLLPTSPE